MTRQSTLWGVLVLVLITVNAQIVHKQMVLDRGCRVLLELAPVDPRSLMQGDYMVLDYAVSRAALNHTGEKRDGCLVLEVGGDDVGRYRHVHDGAPVGPGEQLLRYRRRARVQLGAEAYFFQEGQRERYQKARYGELRVDASGESVLVGLCDAERRPL